jgi:hypothetical protein
MLQDLVEAAEILELELGLLITLCLAAVLWCIYH